MDESLFASLTHQFCLSSVPSTTASSPSHTIFIPQGGILVRLYATVFVFWILVWYTLQLLNEEWIQVLAM
jgi:hypothetical protein